MTRRTKVMSAGACAAALAIAGGGAALAATARNGGTANSSKGKAQASSSPRAFAFGRHAFAFHGGPGDKLSAAAGYLGLSGAELLTQLRSGKTLAQIADATAGKSAAGLVDVLVAAEKKELADAVTAGRLTQSQAEAIGAGLQQRVTAFVHGTFRGGPAGGRLFGHDGPGEGMSAAAGYLGLSGAELLTQLRSGKTLAQIADATPGKSAAGLVDVLVAAEKKELADAVTAGRLTQSQAEAIGAGLQQRVTAFVHGALPPAGFGGPRDWHGHDDGPGAFGFRRGGFSSGGGIAPPADAPPPGGPTI